MKARSIKKNIALNTFSGLLRIITPFITAPYIARVLGASAIGEYSFINSLATYFSVFISLGTGVYGVIEISRRRDSEYERSKTFWEIETLTLLTTIIALAVWTIVVAVTTGNKIYYIIMFLTLLSSFFDISWFYAGLEHFEYAVIQGAVLKVATVVLLLLLVKSPSDLWIYILLVAGGAFVSSVLLWMHLPKYLVRVKFRELKIIRHLRGTLIFFIPSIANTLYAVLDKTIIGFASTSAENGYYTQASSLLAIVQTMCFTGLNTVLMSRNSYLYEKGMKEEIKHRISLSIDYILLIGVASIFGMWAVAGNFVPIFYGEGFDRTCYMLYALVPIVPIVGISNCLGGQYYNPAGLRAKSTKYLVIGIVVNLVLNIVLIPNFGGMGAAIASVIAELVATILYILNADGYCTMKTIGGKIWKKIIAGFIMLAAIYPIKEVIDNKFFIVIIQLIAGVAVYFSVLFILKDREIIKLFFGKLFNKFSKKRNKA